MPSLGGIFKISDGNIAVIAIGVILSTTIGDFLGRYIPSIGNWATVLAGIVITYIAKSNNLLKNFGAGVLIGGLAKALSGIAGSITGAFGEPMMAEDKITYGGGDGVYPMQPDRRVFA